MQIHPAQPDPAQPDPAQALFQSIPAVLHSWDAHPTPRNRLPQPRTQPCPTPGLTSSSWPYMMTQSFITGSLASFMLVATLPGREGA